MKKYTMTCLLTAGLLTGLVLNGCGNTALSHLKEKNMKNRMIDTSTSELSDESTTENTRTELSGEMPESSDAPMEIIENTDVVQGGPYGEISLSVPDDWNYETYPIDSGESIMGMYGIRFHPEGVSRGYIELTYTNSFGVCGMGLEGKNTTIAGQPAYIGTYDNNTFWNFISFQEDFNGIIALAYDVDGWQETYREQVIDILNTLSFDPAIKEDGAYIHTAESEIDTLGLSFSLKNISPTGAILVFNQYDTEAPTGELNTGSDFVLEIQKDGAWEEAPIILGGNYAFNSLAYIIAPSGTTELELNWEWLYGSLAPGTYRIRKSAMDFREPGDYDKYTVYAQFILN